MGLVFLSLHPYDFGKTAGKVSSSAQEALALEAQMQQTISDKIFVLKQHYYSILKDKGIVDVQIKNVKLQKQQLHRAKAYLKSGIKTIIDVSDAQVQVEQAKLALTNARYSVELQKAALEEALGVVPFGGNYTLYSKKLTMKNLDKQLSPMHTPIKALQEYAYKHRYVLSASEYYVNSANANVDVSKGDYYPTLSLDGNYKNQHIDSSNIDANILGITPRQQTQVIVSMKWNLFSGYQTDASVQEAKIGVLKASSQVESVKLSVKREVLESHITLRQSKDNVVLSQSIVKSSLLKFTQAQKRYENELSDYVELQDAQQEYIQSLSDLVNAYYDYFIALAQLDHAIGR
ncbi:MAG: TolC family protein [Sulfurovum sp.]|nr:TolC family protein [Sulfurovum sp.]